MFGLDTLDIVIGLVFVYLILSLIVSAVNEYFAGITNRRGRVLREGIEALLRDRHVAAAVTKHRLFQGLLMQGNRFPSYVPARTFAMALLDSMGYEPGPGGIAVQNKEKREQITDAGAVASAAAPADAHPPQTLEYIIQLLKQDSSLDLMQIVSDPETPKDGNLPEPVRSKAVEVVSGARTEFQKLHDSVEVWFNNGMDRVSGMYKRRTQSIILIIGLVLTLVTNADTIAIWQKLASSDAVRAGLVAQSQAMAEEYAREAAQADSAGAPEAPNVEAALNRFDKSVDRLNQTGLQFGWGVADLQRLGINVGATPLNPPLTTAQIIGNWVAKVVGLLLTVVALSLGAPFWFDALNKIINIRSSGRAPDEKAKSPEAPGKRLAEQPTK